MARRCRKLDFLDNSRSREKESASRALFDSYVYYTPDPHDLKFGRRSIEIYLQHLGLYTESGFEALMRYLDLKREKNIDWMERK